MHIHLHQRRVANAAKAMYLAGLDDKDIARPSFEFFPVDGPETAAFPHELNFIVRMTMRSGTASGERPEEEYGHADIALIGPDEVMRAALEGQIFLADAVHCLPGGLFELGDVELLHPEHRFHRPLGLGGILVLE